jgi:hypothetical protein
MKPLNFSLYTKVVRPMARMVIGWICALIVIVAGVTVVFVALGLHFK